MSLTDGRMRIGQKIPHVIFFLLLLGSGDFQVRGLTVTGKDGPTEALRGEDVTIPCLLSGVLIPLNLQILSVRWSRRLQNGTEYTIYQFHDSHHQSSRPGSHMNDRDLQQGNASLSIPNIQITDEGDYHCSVIVTPDADSATSTLHVSVKPQTNLIYRGLNEALYLGPASCEVGYPGPAFCEVSNFYPEEVKIRWVKHSKGITTSTSLDEDVSFTTPLRNRDGTFNVTSMLNLRPDSRDEPGDIFSCIVTHRSLKEEISLNFTVPRPSPVVVIIILALLVLCIVVLLTILWKKCLRKGEPSLSEISGDGRIPHMKRGTLTWQITNFIKKEIQINVYLKRRNDIKLLISSWDSTDWKISYNDSSNVLSLLEKGAKCRTLLSVEMEVEMTKSWTGKYKCLCSISITPDKYTDDGAVIVVEVEHPSLKWPVSVRRTLNVYSPVVGKPVVSDISGEMWIPHMKTTLSCQITKFKLKKLQINLYLKRCNDMKNHLIHSWVSVDRPSRKDNTAAGRHSRDPIEEDSLLEDAGYDTMLPVEMEDAGNDTILPVEMEDAGNDTKLPVEMEVKMTKTEDESYKCDCTISLTPNIDTDDGAVLAVEVDHAALEWPEYKYHILNVIKGDKPGLWRRWKKRVIK
ncbi:uncharacterized protein LOC120916956 [Rana temporaria]|uniref:uncharacterized protein LOC120916956 n=1 Tax=Rana temporaria TaxID=8407 RepID=UPI001AADD8F3|nr:uncharacterized protein LOC120916956 [Rana temporaria]